MAIAHEFEYARPRTIDEARALLLERGSKAMVLAGGTDVVASLRDELIAPELIVDIKGIPGLAGIRPVGERVLIGSLATFSDLIDSDLVHDGFPLLYEMAVNVGCRGIRNRATVVGNICSAVPSCDAGPALLVHDAQVLVMGPSGQRIVRMKDWFTGPKQNALRHGELVVGVEVPGGTRLCGGSYVKLRRYRGEDLAQASVAVLVSPELEYRVAFGAVGPVPRRPRRLETAIKGREPSDEFFSKTRKIIGHVTAPITDIRATAEYRRHMLNVMFERAVRAAVSRMRGEGPPYGEKHI
jgi:CO/xanthine dehydrogenase FAD-binding subunit